MIIIVATILILLILGMIERIRHQRRVNRIPLRININGIRGKSTVTRLITGIMMEDGRRTIGKTTGTQARMIYWNKTEEEPIQRRPEGPNIREQKMVIKKSSELGADCLVSECMAVNPDYQVIFQRDMLQANIGVIVNVLEDHMDVMGPTLREVAEAFTATIPENGHLIVNDSPYVPYFKRIAQERNTRVWVCDTSRISESYLRQFEYMIFPENAALALAVAEAAGVDEQTAFRGMLKAPPDPGAMRILPVGDPERPGYFVNGFAANDATSTRNIWDRVQALGYPIHKEPMIIMNCRADRVDRTEQFARDVLPYIPADTLVLVGETTSPLVRAYEQNRLPVNHLLNLEEQSTEQMMEVLTPLLDDRLIYGVGNIHGAAEPLVEWLKQQRRQESNCGMDGEDKNLVRI
ncbi:poly-gamma-glutamate synthase PgsB [Melghirimyces algeriensis]|uniref:Poly-gamma-glutamate synthase PgsB/CapB n=1 Tax=Melghirimyces algeriensis TaxID=910412 RepID=A0A521ABZ1_9BACL|nr:poly-gamma-glutamate synthase PgsB [Melghirimyces algeriensis]SMO32271.1 poly-gamma-glutamate synthase PgsB/CapB [Melghirimyces algeriensis]